MDHFHGVVTSTALRDAGISEKRLRRMPEYERLAPGCYAMPGARRDFMFQAAWALTVAGEDASLTGDSCLHVLNVLDQIPRRVDVAVREGKGSRKRAGFAVRRSSHYPEPILVRHGLRLTPAAYAIGDFARDASDKAVAFAITRLLGKRLTTLDEIAAVADDRGSFPGSARLRRVLRAFGGKTSHSVTERQLKKGLAEIGIHAAAAPLNLYSPDGRWLGEADIPIMDIQLDVEVDGLHHLLPAQQAKDRHRDRGLKGIDWDVVRYMCYEVDEDLEGVVRQIANLVRKLRV